MKHRISLTDKTPVLHMRGIFKFRLSNEPCSAISMATVTMPPNPPTVEVPANNPLMLEEANYSEDSGLDNSDLESGDDWNNDFDL